MRELPDRALDYPDPQGAAQLRRSVSGYLRRVRAVAADPDGVVICAGFTQALSLLTSALGAPLIALEDPGPVGRDQIIAAAGGSHLPVAVDEHGLHVEQITASAAAAVTVTPTHQFSLGVALDATRRSQLLDWARDGHLIIEDDYDAEFATTGLRSERCRGSRPSTSRTSARLKDTRPSPAPGLAGSPLQARRPRHPSQSQPRRGTPTLDQLALAHLIDSGTYERHLRRLRRRYRQRRDQLLAVLDHHLPAARISGMAAGLHLVVHLASQPHTAAIVTAAAARGLAIVTLDLLQARRTRPPRPPRARLRQHRRRGGRHGNRTARRNHHLPPSIRHWPGGRLRRPAEPTPPGIGSPQVPRWRIPNR
ncbi:MAG: hypothetical protein ACR2IP_10425 [Solirubrobacteraceae bacterium]